MMSLAPNYLRRRDSRRRVLFAARVECRGVVQKVRIVDFSASGLRLDGIQGLATGDPIELHLTPEIQLKGQVAWSVWHKAGVMLNQPLPPNHPVYLFLEDQARAIDRARTLALVAIAKERARS